VIPNRGVDGALAEIDRVVDRPGMRGFVMGCYPNGTLAPAPDDDKVWARIEELGMPLSIHVSLTDTMPSAHKVALPGWGRIFDLPNRMLEMIFAGVFDRFPALQMVAAEVDCGWLPYVKEQIDNNFQRLAPGSTFAIERRPSEYIEQHFHFGFMTDPIGIRLRDAIGVERMLWSSDYPHVSSDWPHSWRTILNACSGVPAAERELILAGNAQRLYGFGSGG
jgi:predicted TIM-barrel fold metal-dependent hydrolase